MRSVPTHSAGNDAVGNVNNIRGILGDNQAHFPDRYRSDTCRNAAGCIDYSASGHCLLGQCT